MPACAVQRTVTVAVPVSVSAEWVVVSGAMDLAIALWVGPMISVLYLQTFAQ